MEIPKKPEYTSAEVELAVSARRKKIANLKKRMIEDPSLEKKLMPEVSNLIEEIGNYQKNEVKK